LKVLEPQYSQELPLCAKWCSYRRSIITDLMGYLKTVLFAKCWLE